MTRLTPTRTRPDIVAETFNYTVVHSLYERVTAMNLHPTKRDRNYFRVIPKETAEGTAYHSSQWETYKNRATHTVIGWDLIEAVVKFNNGYLNLL